MLCIVPEGVDKNKLKKEPLSSQSMPIIKPQKASNLNDDIKKNNVETKEIPKQLKGSEAKQSTNKEGYQHLEKIKAIIFQNKNPIKFII